MKAYSKDLRKKIGEAVERRGMKSMAAKTLAFEVSRSCVKRHTGAARDGKPLTPKQHPGSNPKLDETMAEGMAWMSHDECADFLSMNRDEFGKVAKTIPRHPLPRSGQAQSQGAIVTTRPG